jgi:hypothetical protein
MNTSPLKATQMRRSHLSWLNLFFKKSKRISIRLYEPSQMRRSHLKNKKRVIQTHTIKKKKSTE